jgi:hypothetical protein
MVTRPWALRDSLMAFFHKCWLLGGFERGHHESFQGASYSREV